ncbi:hypothetical protein AVEN_58132-1 [Araneus ventricosus]|uniref:Uncharacterized protein n=1 Tax=Araneus ventricosus TaxID=182803 RepID=A0A4Y2QS87_ARAVE|nr:hypothetical protein AVEN_58132-1 [Araneus ventricosus]
MLNIYEEVSDVMAFADNFLSYYAFIIVLISLVGLFTLSYLFAFFIQEDYYSYLLIISGIIYYLLLLLSVMLPAAAANEAAEIAKSTIKPRGSCIPHSYKDLEMYLRPRLEPSVAMTLWKIYKIDKSLLISSLGTLLTYGMLWGTLGNVYN